MASPATRNGADVKRAIAIGLAALLLSACGTPRIHDAIQHPVANAGTRLPAAIEAAAKAQGWQLRPLRSDAFEATRTAGLRMARIDILFDDHGYRLRYRDSSAMDFDGRDIDADYNRWIEALDQAIASRLQHP